MRASARARASVCVVVPVSFWIYARACVSIRYMCAFVSVCASLRLWVCGSVRLCVCVCLLASLHACTIESKRVCVLSCMYIYVCTNK